MCATVLDMSVSLDGFIAGPNERLDNGLGDGGHRLHEWALAGAVADHKEVAHPAGVNGEVFDELMSTGAVVAGRGTFEPAGGWGGDHHDGVPIFILYRQEPGIDIEQWPLVARLAIEGLLSPRSCAGVGASPFGARRCVVARRGASRPVWFVSSVALFSTLCARVGREPGSG